MTWILFQRFIYSLIRTFMAYSNQVGQKDYEKVVHIGQTMLSALKIASFQVNYSQKLAALNMKSSVFELEFLSPITFAAFESHMPSIDLWLKLGCGGGCLKTIKLQPHNGNARPRMQQLAINNQQHLLNALGLPGPGVEKWVQIIQESMLNKYQCPIGISIGGHSLEEYKHVISTIAKQESSLPLFQQYYEINISCPNTTTGKSLHDQLSELEALIQYCKTITDKVLVIKVSPDATNQNLCNIAEIVKSYQRVTINAGNTQYRTCDSLGLKQSTISIGGGGLSGPSLFNRTLEMIKLLAPFQLPLIATGGIETVNQIKQIKESGASIIGMATKLVKNPFDIVIINKALANK